MPNLPSYPLGGIDPAMNILPGLRPLSGQGPVDPGMNVLPPGQQPPALGGVDPGNIAMPLQGRPPVGGLNPDFAHRFTQLHHAVRQAGGDLYIFSGARDKEHQQMLWNQAVAKYGDPTIAAKHVKEPGKSAHDPEFGIAKGLGPGALGVDIRGDLHIAHDLAPKYGIEFPHESHPWHMEMAGHNHLKS